MIVPLLQTKSLTKRFGGVVAVDEVNFSAGHGELRCLVGPNGAGKTTFFKMLSGQISPTAGEVLLKGESLAGKPASSIARRGLGIKTQVPSVFGGLSVEENVRLAAARALPALLARRRVDEALARLRIGDLRRRIVNELAHGQRQLVELAMVIAPEPELILLDEPAAGITGAEVDLLAELVVDLARSGSVIVVEHDMAFIRQIAKTVTVFNRGRVLAEGPAAEVLADQRVRDVYLGDDSV